MSPTVQPTATKLARGLREIREDADAPQYLGLVSGGTTMNPTARIEYALRADEALGEAQVRRLEALLAAPEIRGRFRVLVIHHPPVMQRPPENRNLLDRARLAEVLARVGAELVVHGHDHRDEFAELAGPDGRRIPVVGAGSASYAGAAERCSRYNIYEIDGPRVDVITYAHDSATGTYREVRRRRI